MLESTFYVSGIAVFEGNSARGKGIRSVYLILVVEVARLQHKAFARRTTFLKYSAKPCGGYLV